MSRAEISLFIKRLQLMFDFCCFLSTKINWHFIWWRKTGRRLSLSGCARDTPSSTCSARTLSSKAAKCSYPFSHLERGTLRKGWQLLPLRQPGHGCWGTSCGAPLLCSLGGGPELGPCPSLPWELCTLCTGPPAAHLVGTVMSRRQSTPCR